MLIDIHTHLGDHRRSREDKRPAVTLEGLLKRLDEEGIDRAVILPSNASPECRNVCFVTNKEVIEAYKKYPQRIIPFCSMDPRNVSNSPDADFSWILEEYKEAGYKGVGEFIPNLYFDHPMVKNFFHHCEKAGLPLLFHMAKQIGGVYGVVDDIHLPRLEQTLKEFPRLIFIGHAMAFWAEVDGDVKEETRGGYPKGEVKEGGRVPQLLKKYPNLYGDLSAGSGYNAISRDIAFGYRFLEEFQDKLFFGTDICFLDQDLPQGRFLKKALEEGKISQQAYDKIAYKNALRVLQLKE